MNQRYRTMTRILLCTAVVFTAFASAGMARLILPGTPGRSSTMTFEGFIELPRAGTLNKLDYITYDDDRLFVSDEGNGSVYKVTLQGGSSPADAIVETFPGQGAAHGIVVDPTSHVAFVSRSVANTVDAFDPATLKLIKKIPVADDADGIFYEPTAKLIYVANGDPKLATLIDPRHQQTVATIPLHGKPEFAAFDPQQNLLYQNLRDINEIAAIDVGRGLVQGAWLLPGCQGPAPVAMDTRSRRLFVGCATNSRLLVLDLDSRKVIRALPAAGQPDSIAYDPDLHRLYVTGRGGILSVVQQDSANDYRVLETVPMHYGAHTLAIDPSTHEVYVGYASLFVPPRLAVFRPKR